MTTGVSVGILDEEERAEAPRVTFRCPPELYARLERAVEESGKTRSKVIVRLLTFALEALEKEPASSKRSKK